MIATSVRNKDLISAYMRHVGKTYYTNDAGDLTPLLPFFILDSAYQLYLAHILPLKCSHGAKHWRSVWRDTYNALNQSFFSAFDDDQRDAVIDKMESLETFISEQMERTREVIEQFLSATVPQDKTFVISVCMVCNVLAQSASLIYQKVYLDSTGHNAQNRAIDKLAHSISKFLNSWYRPDCYINCNEDEAVDSAVTALQARVFGWLKTTHEVPQTEKP